MATQVKYLDYVGLQELVLKIKAGDAKALADAKAYVGEIPASATEKDAISYLMAKIDEAKKEATFDGKAASVTLEDANQYYVATDVEGALAEVKIIADDAATDLATIKGEGTGSIKKALADAKEYTNTSIGTLETGGQTYSTVVEYVDVKDAAISGTVATAQETADQAVLDAAAAQADATSALDKIGKETEGEVKGTGLTGRIEDLEAAIGEGGGVAQQIEAAINKLDATVTNHVDATEEDPNPTQPDVEVSVTEVDGKLTAVTAKVNAKYDAEGAAATAKAEAIDASAVTISTDSTTEGALKTYTFTQNGAEIGKIDLAKDLVVTGGRVVKNPEGQPEGTYLELTIANQEAKVYINVLDLVNDFTVEADADKVQLAISDEREISATIVSGSIERTDIDEDFEADVKAIETALGEKKDGAFVTVANQINAQAKDAVYQAATDEDPAVTIAGALDDIYAQIGEGGGVADQIKTAIEALDATATHDAGADGLSLSVTEVDGKITAISGAIAAETYDEFGAAEAAASAVSGYGKDETAKTVKDVAEEVAAITSITDDEIDALFEDETE